MKHNKFIGQLTLYNTSLTFSPHIFTFTSAVKEYCSLKQPGVWSKKMIQPVSHKYMLKGVGYTHERGWPGAGRKQNRVNPHQCSRSISAHWVSHHPSLCEKDSVRLMGDWHVVANGWPAERSRRLLFLLLGQALHQLQLLHWFPLLIDCDKLQRNARNKKVKLAAVEQKATRRLSEQTFQRSNSLEQAGTNLIRFLPQWLSNFCLAGWHNLLAFFCFFAFFFKCQ